MRDEQGGAPDEGRGQALDRLLVSAVRGVEPPAGLAARVAARVAAQVARERGVSRPAVLATEPPGAVPRVARREHGGRGRRGSGLRIGLAAAVLVGLATAPWGPEGVVSWPEPPAWDALSAGLLEAAEATLALAVEAVAALDSAPQAAGALAGGPVLALLGAIGAAACAAGLWEGRIHANR